MHPLHQLKLLLDINIEFLYLTYTIAIYCLFSIVEEDIEPSHSKYF